MEAFTHESPCPYPIYPREATPVEETSSESVSNVQYYSGWIAYASYVSPSTAKPFTSFSSEWTVPPKPPKTNILTTTFLFNGLEDAHPNPSFILQPVLQYGYSGCGGGLHWTFTSFFVNNAGRAYCGKMLKVKEGDALKGVMSLDSTTGKWNIVSTVNDGEETSTYAATISQPIHYAVVTLEIIRAYSCGAYPGNDAMTFVNNVLSPPVLPSNWNTTVSHEECGQGVSYAKRDTMSDDVIIHYKADIRNVQDITEIY